MKLNQTCETISGAGNTVSNCVAYFEDIRPISEGNYHRISFVAYAISNVVAIGDTTTNETWCTLRGHKVRINTILHILFNKENFLLSVSDDGVCILWKHSIGTKYTYETVMEKNTRSAQHSGIFNDCQNLQSEWTIAATFGGKASAGSSAFALTASATASPLGIIINTANICGVISTYCYTNRPSKDCDNAEDVKTFHLLQLSTLKIPLVQLPKAMNSVIWYINGEEDCNSPFMLFLFTGAVDHKVHAHCCSSELLNDVIDRMNAGVSNISSNTAKNSIYTSSCVLSGHEDWVTCLSVSKCIRGKGVGSDRESDHVFVASGSQDTFIRVWKLKLNTTLVDNLELSSNSKKLNHHNFCSAADVADKNSAPELDGESSEEEEEEEVTESGSSDTSRKKEKKGGVSVESKEQKEHAKVIPKVAVKEESVTEIRASLYSSHSNPSESDKFASHRIDITLDALLIGHEEWVTGVEWMDTVTQIPDFQNNGGRAVHSHCDRLFSTSMDRNMIIWTPDDVSGVWNPNVRIGDIGGALGGSVGGNLLGFIGGCVVYDQLLSNQEHPQSASILGLGYGGSFHMWRCNHQGGTGTGGYEHWQPYPSFTGHFDVVTDCSWSSDGQYIVTVSADQTCRVWAFVINDHSMVLSNECKTNVDVGNGHWREISRPQIHGYNLTSVALHPCARDKTPTSFVLYSGGDEKIIRAFDATGIVLEQFSNMCGLYGDIVESGASFETDGEARLYKAYIPELGLSNKGTECMSAAEKEEQSTRHVHDVGKASSEEGCWRALEGQLTDNTIWSEKKKLYGHSNDVVCLTVSNYCNWECDKVYLVSSCKARDTNTASLFVWDVSSPSMLCVGQLSGGHDSTVVAIQFSPNNKYIASAGKDRTLCIHSYDALTGSDACPYATVICHKSAHKRIIWDLRWVCGASEDDSDSSSTLISASRDGVCKVWKLVMDTETLSSLVALNCVTSFQPFNHIGNSSVTALDALPIQSLSSLDFDSILVAFGSDGGEIVIYELNKVDESDGFSCVLVHETANHWCHGASVKRLRWYGSNGKPVASDVYRLLSCGDDNTMRLFKYCELNEVDTCEQVN